MTVLRSSVDSDRDDVYCFFLPNIGLFFPTYGFFQNCLFPTHGRKRSAFVTTTDDDEKAAPETPSPVKKGTDGGGELLMKLSSNKLQPRIFPWNQEHAWDELEDDLFVLLDGQMTHLDYFRRLHHAGVIRSNLLHSLAYLASRPAKRNEARYFEHISNVASFLSLERSAPDLRIPAVRTLMACRSPSEAAWQLTDAAIHSTLSFLTNPRFEWEDAEQHSERVLIWELRAMCLRQIERVKQRVERVASSGEMAASFISCSAALVESGMTRSVPAVSRHIENIGTHVKGSITPSAYPLIMSRNAVVAMTYSDAAKRASESAKERTRQAVQSIRHVSSRGLNIVASKLEDRFGENLAPESREVLRTAGKIGLATLGAAAVIGETVVESSRVIVHKTTSVTADVVQHKYGTTAGQVVQDVGETVGNILRTLGHVACLEGSSAMKSMAQNAGKTHVANDISNVKKSLHYLGEKAMGRMKEIASMSDDAALQEACKKKINGIPVRCQSFEACHQKTLTHHGEVRDENSGFSNASKLIRQSSALLERKLQMKRRRSSVSLENKAIQPSQSSVSSDPMAPSPHATIQRSMSEFNQYQMSYENSCDIKTKEARFEIQKPLPVLKVREHVIRRKPPLSLNRNSNIASRRHSSHHKRRKNQLPRCNRVYLTPDTVSTLSKENAYRSRMAS